MEKIRVLFICTGNKARSQMAEALLRKYAGDRFEVYSAGLEPGLIHPYTIQVLREAGVDTAGLYSKGIDQFLGRMHFGYVITVCAHAEEQCPIFPGVTQRLHWPFEDPLAFQGTEEEKLAKFRQVRDQIDQRIRAWLKEMSFSKPVRQEYAQECQSGI